MRTNKLTSDGWKLRIGDGDEESREALAGEVRVFEQLSELRVTITERGVWEWCNRYSGRVVELGPRTRLGAGFDVRVSIETDSDPDASYLGEYTDKCPRTGREGRDYFDRFRAEAGNALDNFASVDDIEDECRRIARREHTLRYFVPGECNTYKGNADAWKSHGVSKHDRELLARCPPREAYRRMDELNNGNGWRYCVVHATASRQGVELGSFSLHGNEYLPDWPGNQDYLNDVARDAIAQAVDEAKTKLGKLKRASGLTAHVDATTRTTDATFKE